MDSLVAGGIAFDVSDFDLGDKFHPWQGVVHLTPDLNAKYQQAANDIAIKRGLRCRVHLDLIYWRSQNGEGNADCITADQSDPL